MIKRLFRHLLTPMVEFDLIFSHKKLSAVKIYLGVGSKFRFGHCVKIIIFKLVRLSPYKKKG